MEEPESTGYLSSAEVQAAPVSNLHDAARAVLKRWDSPQWDWHREGPTADLMADLRAALAASTPTAKPAAWRWPVPKLRGQEWRYTATQTRPHAQPLYDQAALDAEVAAERDRIKAALIGMDEAAAGRHNYYAHAALVLFERS